MKTYASILVVLIGLQAKAESINVGCADMSAFCSEQPDKTYGCSWSSNMGHLYAVEIQKTGSGPNYDIWQGHLDGVAINKYPYRVDVYQRREASQSFNYLTVAITVNGFKVSGGGQNVGDVKLLSEKDTFGIGVHCTTDLVPAP